MYTYTHTYTTETTLYIKNNVTVPVIEFSVTKVPEVEMPLKIIIPV